MFKNGVLYVGDLFAKLSTRNPEGTSFLAVLIFTYNFFTFYARKVVKHSKCRFYVLHVSNLSQPRNIRWLATYNLHLDYIRLYKIM